MLTRKHAAAHIELLDRFYMCLSKKHICLSEASFVLFAMFLTYKNDP